jgi:hypothetical protein
MWVPLSSPGESLAERLPGSPQAVREGVLLSQVGHLQLWGIAPSSPAATRGHSPALRGRIADRKNAKAEVGGVDVAAPPAEIWDAVVQHDLEVAVLEAAWVRWDAACALLARLGSTSLTRSARLIPRRRPGRSRTFASGISQLLDPGPVRAE